MPTPPAESATVNLTVSGSFGAVGGAAFTTNQVQPAGTGTFGTFLQIQNNGVEQGYNTDFRPAQFDEQNTANHNHSLLLASVPIVEGDGTNGTVEGVLYREFLLDLNDGGGGNAFLSLDALQIYQADVGNLTGFNQPIQQGGTGTGFGSNATLVYNLDAGGDSWIAMNASLSSGSGESDVQVLIPDSLFDPNTPYVVLYSALGYQDVTWRANSGSEEWGTRGPQGAVPALNIAMTATVPGGTADTPGEVITYAITVRNVGNTSLTGVTVDDPSVSDLTRGADVVGNNDSILNTGEIWSFTAHHTVTQAEIDSNGTGDAGAIVNTATADSDQTGPDTATASVPVERLPQLEIIKTADVASVDAAGDVINYVITIENTGSTSLTSPVVRDLVPVPVLNPDAPILDPNVGIFFPLLDGDFNLGDTNQNNAQDPGETFQYVYPGDTNLDGFHDLGETWTAFNLGDTDQDGFHDPGETWVGDTNQNGMEEAGERWQFQNLGDANHNNLQDAGETWQYLNIGDDNQNGVQDSGETFFFRNAGDTNQNGVEDTGETFQYYNAGDTNQDGDEDPGETFQFTTIAQALPGVDADNNGFNDGDADADGIVDFGETWLYTGPSHTVTQDEIDNGGIVDPGLSIDNTADASTDQTATVVASASVFIEQRPEVTLANAAVGGTYNDANLNGRPDEGETISYTFAVTNSGNMTLYDIAVGDPVVTVTGTTIASLAPGASDGASFTGTYVIQQADIDAGLFNNTSTVTATAGAPQGHPVSDDDAEQVTLPQDVSLTIDKTGTWVDGDGDGFADVDERIDYVITVVNDGNVTLHDVQVNDTLLGGPLGDPDSGDADSDGLLDVGETWTFNASDTIDQDDIDAGTVHNEATATALGPQDQPVSESDDNDEVLPQNPRVSVGKTGEWVDGDGDGFADVGEQVDYVITVENDGNVTLHDVEVNDPLLGGPLSGPDGGDADSDGLLDVGETWTFNASYTIDQADIDAGTVHNRATATALGPQDQPVNGADDNDATLPQNPHLTIAKTGAWVDGDGDGFADVGEEVDYVITVENDGNVTLHDVEVNDPLLGGLLSGPDSGDEDSDGLLDVGETWTFNASYAIDQADIDAGNVHNEATATALGPQDQPVTDSDDHDAALPQNAAVELVKTGEWIDANQNGIAEEGETIEFTFTINNTGNVTLHDVGVSDLDGDVMVFGSPIPALAPGATDDTTWSGTYTITGIDVGNGFYDNTAVAIANEASDSGSSHVELPQDTGEAALFGPTETPPKWSPDYLF